VKLALQLAGTLALVALGWLCVEGALTVRYARGRSVYTFDQVNKVLRESSQTLDELRKASTVWATSSQKQSSSILKATQLVSVDAVQFSTLLSETGKSINSSLIPTIQASVAEQNNALSSNQAKLGADLDSLKNELEALRGTTEAATAQITNPALSASLANVAAASGQLEAVSEDAHKAADMALAKEQDILHPPPEKFAVRVFKFLAGHLVDGTEMWYYLYH
jgi:hypothetical protein